MNSLINEVTLTGTIISSSELVGSIQSTQFLCGTINSIPKITGTISGGRAGNLIGQLQSQGTITGIINISDGIPEYQGGYIITPKIHAQLLNTKDRILKDNISVLEIPYYETSNLTGKTVYIGGE